MDNDVIKDSVFKLHDTLTSRAEIGDLTAVFREEVVAVIGLGGTGAYLLDLLVKTPVKEVRGFDGDDYHVHTAYRSPGRLLESELGVDKAGVYQGRYDNFRNGLKLRRKYIDRTSQENLQGVTFAFVCVDKGSTRAETRAEILKWAGAIGEKLTPPVLAGVRSTVWHFGSLERSAHWARNIDIFPANIRRDWE